MMQSNSDTHPTHFPMSDFEHFVIVVVGQTRLFSETRSPEIVADVASFVEQQIELLPRQLRVAVKIAVKYFTLEPYLFKGKRFSGLSEQAQVKHFKGWESSRFAAKRDFSRFIRSIVLFNYYDHPKVRSII